VTLKHVKLVIDLSEFVASSFS